MKTQINKIVPRALALAGLVINLTFIQSAKADTFTNTGALNTARQTHTATWLPNGKVLVAGGGSVATADLFDPSNDTFTPTTGNMQQVGRSGHTGTLLPNGKVLLAGGSPNWLTSAELYDPATQTFSATGSMAGARRVHTAALLPNGKVLVISGSSGGGGAPERRVPVPGLRKT